MGNILKNLLDVMDSDKVLVGSNKFDFIEETVNTSREFLEVERLDEGKLDPGLASLIKEISGMRIQKSIGNMRAEVFYKGNYYILEKIRKDEN